MATATLARQIGSAIIKATNSTSSEGWFSPHMAAASRAIAERIPLVDLVLEVRDARVFCYFHFIGKSHVFIYALQVFDEMLGSYSVALFSLFLL